MVIRGIIILLQKIDTPFVRIFDMPFKPGDIVANSDGEDIFLITDPDSSLCIRLGAIGEGILFEVLHHPCGYYPSEGHYSKVVNILDVLAMVLPYEK